MSHGRRLAEPEAGEDRVRLILWAARTHEGEREPDVELLELLAAAPNEPQRVAAWLLRDADRD